MAESPIWFDVPSRRDRVAYACVRALVVGGCRLWFRAEVDGGHNIPAEGPFILSPVHRSYIDTPLVAAVTRRELRYMGKEEMWNNRLMGTFLSAMGGFPVARGTADREALRRCQAVLETGQALVMFPEGTRQEGPVVEHVFDGPAFVSTRTGAPIVPVGIGGSARAMPKSAKFVRPTKVLMIVGEPIHPPPRPEGRSPSRRQVRELTEQVRDAIQELYDTAQERVGAPF